MNAIGKLLQVVWILDTTGSMGWLREIFKETLLKGARKLLNDFPRVQIGLIFIGDDNNRNERYSVESLEFTDDLQKIVNWIDKVGNSYGGGPHANYELGLRAARKLNWLPDSIKLVEVVGDEGPNDRNFKHLDGSLCDWRFEVGELVGMGCTIDAVHCFPGMQRRTRCFYDELSTRGHGCYFPQDQFTDLEIIALARVYTALSIDVGSESSPIGRYEAEVRSQRRMTKSVDQTFAKLTGRRAQEFAQRTDVEPVPSGRFQLLTVNKKGTITEFLLANKFEASGGEAVKRLYRYTGLRDGKPRSEEVHWYKDIVLRDRTSGNFYSGDGVRTILGLPLVASQQNIKFTPKMIPDDFDVFFESTSHNRPANVGDEWLIDQSHGKSSAKRPCR